MSLYLVVKSPKWRYRKTQTSRVLVTVAASKAEALSRARPLIEPAHPVGTERFKRTEVHAVEIDKVYVV